jgi:AcrR family transcriptional regulator
MLGTLAGGLEYAAVTITGVPRGRKPRVTREGIIDATLKMIDSQGLEALSMRRLGKDLGVDPMAIYGHFESKSDLIDAVIDSIMARVDIAGDDPSSPWEERAIRLSYAYRDALRAHTNLLPAIASGRARMFGGLAPAETLLSIFDAAGVPRHHWMIAMSVFSSWVLGATIMELTAGDGASDVIVDWALNVSPGLYPHVSTAVATHTPDSPDAFFRYGTLSLVAGLGTLAARKGPASSAGDMG